MKLPFEKIIFESGIVDLDHIKTLIKKSMEEIS